MLKDGLDSSSSLERGMLLERWFKKMGLAVNSDFVEVKNGT